MISQKVRQQEKGREGVNLATNSPFTEGFLKLKNVYIYICVLILQNRSATALVRHGSRGADPSLETKSAT